MLPLIYSSALQLDKMVLMMGYQICFYVEIWLIDVLPVIGEVRHRYCFFGHIGGCVVGAEFSG